MSSLGGFRQGPYRDLLKHSLIYGLGQVLSRITSIILLPLYTKYLRPADYGVIAILDLVGGALSILLGTGIVSAASRYHFEAKTEEERQKVWWTGLTLCVISATSVLLPLMFLRESLARLTLGSEVANGGFYYGLILANLWFDIVGQLPDSYLKVRKRSGVSVGISFARLFVNATLNISLLVVFQLGVAGVLLGNLITGGGVALCFLAIIIRDLGSYSFHLPLIRQFWKFGGPLIITSLLAMLMHQADRFLLRLFVNMEQIGLYSFAYTIGQGVNTAFVAPFFAIWDVVIYEIRLWPDQKRFYVRVFEYFFYGLMLVMLGVSLSARQLLSMIAPPDYLGAADLIPIVCLAYVFFSLHGHFRVPVLLAKRTETFPFVYAVATSVNVIANLILVPRFGPVGAAWASVVSFAIFSLVGLWRYRTIEQYEYPLLKCGAALLGVVTSYIGFQLMIHLEVPYLWLMGAALVVWITWVGILFGPLALRLWGGRQFLPESQKMIWSSKEGIDL